MPSELDRLNAMDYGELLAWLEEALEGKAALPRLSPDEPPYIGILRLEAALDKPTRRDLTKACADLVLAFARQGEGDEEFATSLLRLTTGLSIDAVAGPLARMAERFPQLPAVSGPVKALVLATLVDLKVPQSVEFWHSMLDQDRKAFAGIAVTGLLARNMTAAIDVLRTLPEEQAIADAVTIVLEQATDQLAPGQRSEVYGQIRVALRSCSPLMRGSILEWLEERGELVASQQQHDYGKLDRVLLRRNPQYTPKPAASRLSVAA